MSDKQSTDKRGEPRDDFEAWLTGFWPLWRQDQHGRVQQFRCCWNAAQVARGLRAAESATASNSEESVLLEAALSVMEEWDEGLDEQDGPEYQNACKDWADCLAALREWKRLRSA